MDGAPVQETVEIIELIEHELILNLKYKVGKNVFDMIYHKEKDKVMLMRDGEPVSKMSALEELSYKEALDICISYHHNRENEQLH